jgi:pentatricopeptide repeat protein
MFANWQHWGCLVSVQQDAILYCSQLDCHEIGTCEMWLRAQGTGTISTNATGGCANVSALEEGRCAHEQIIQSGCDLDVSLGNSLIDMYAKSGSMEDAHWVFNEMPAWNMVSLNAVLGGCAMHGQSNEALKTFEQMCEHVQSNDITSVCLLSACNHAGLVDPSLYFYAWMNIVYLISATLEQYPCMINLLGHDGCLQEAENMI